MKRLNVTILLVFIFLLLAACAPAPTEQQEEPTVSPAEPAQPEPGQPTSIPETYTVDLLAGLPEDALVLQLDYDPTFSLPRYRYMYGRVPVFTLLADGRVFYVDEEQPDQPLLVAQLSPDETVALLQEIYDLGIAGLESHTDFCMPQADGTDMCVADASYTILRSLLPDGSYREVTSYANFSNEPQNLEAITSLLSSFTHEGAQPYVPTEAALFLQPASGEMSGEPEPYPLSGNYAPPSLAETGIWAFFLTGDDLASYLAATAGKPGIVIFEINGSPYQAELVPWLPGFGYQQELEKDFPPDQAVPVQG